MRPTPYLYIPNAAASVVALPWWKMTAKVIIN
jgi:hypothetical protein